MEHPQRALRGAYGIVLTPFDKSGQVDIPLLEKHVDRLCKSDIDGLVTCGSTSEFVFLSPEENIHIMECVSRVNAGRKTIICGATAADTGTVLQYLEHIAALDADYALVAPPYYFHHSDDELIAFYRDISERQSRVKIIAYQIPAFTSGISMRVYRAILAMPNIVGLKNSSADIKQIMHQLNLRNRERPVFSILSGTDDALVPSLVAGCDGSFTACGAILPEVIAALYHALSKGDIAGALEIQNSLLPLLAAADQLSFPIGYKLLANACGIETGTLRQSMGESGHAAIAMVTQTLSIELDILRKKGLLDKLNVL